MTKDQKDAWEREKRAVRRLRDGLGKPVDQPVVTLLVALRLLGFHTHSSCGGHFDRPSSPYVAFRSAKNQVDRQQIESASTQAAARRLRNKAIQHNAGELARMLRLVECFYDERLTPRSQQLIVQGFGVIGYRLTAQAADLVYVAANDERRELVDAQRREFDAFTDFLKAEFFATWDDTLPRVA